MKFEFRKLIIPVIALILVIGVIYGITSFVSNRNSSEPSQSEELRSPDSLLDNLNPAQNIETEEEKITVSGKTKSRRNQVFVNGEKAKVNKDGEFSKELSLKDGVNDITVKAETPNKKVDERKLTVIKRGSGQNDQSIPEQAPKEEETGTNEPQIPNDSNLTKEDTPGVPSDGELSVTGPKENAAFALAAVFVTYFYWRKSKANLRKV